MIEKSTGKKLYPVCCWEHNQHKIYNAYDRAFISAEGDGYSIQSLEQLEKVERALEAFDKHVWQGVVYATYENGELIKELICAYDMRH